MSTPMQEPGALLLTAGYETTPVPVPRISPYDGFRMLGAYISPSGSNALAKMKLRSISLEYATAITGSGLN